MIYYFFPGVRGIPDAWSYSFPLGACGCPIKSGPAKKISGWIASRLSDIPPTYNPFSQYWQELSDGVWIGCEKKVDIARFQRGCEREDELNGVQRGVSVPGHWVKLGDGNTWLIPVANPLVATCSLPVYESLRPSGEWESKVVDEYYSISERALELAMKAYDSILTADKSDCPILEFDEDDIRNLFADIIKVNYSLTRHELSVMRVFMPGSYLDVIKALIDWEEFLGVMAARINEVSKKKA